MTSPKLARKHNSPRLSTGNEFISIPDISVDTAGIEAAGVMHSAFRACIELHGSDREPLLRPVVEVDGEPLRVTGGEHISYWIPRFTLTSEKASATATVFAPLERRGFVYILNVSNNYSSDIRIKAGWCGCWNYTYHTAILSKLMAGSKHGSTSSWQAGVPVIEFRGHTPLFAIALLSGDSLPAQMWGEEDGDGPAWPNGDVSARAGFPIHYTLMDEYVLKPGESKVMPLYVGIGLEEVSAVASARDLRLHGWERLFSGLKSWLDKHTIECEDERLKQVMNVNSFYNYFFAQGTAIDTEELVVMAARSSRSESCAAYRDSDAMRWSLPAVLQVNSAQARNMLIYTYTRQLANVGVRSRFIDGLVLEPGLQLDQLCAPIRALYTYVQSTDDMSVLFDRRVQTGINIIQQIIGVQRHPEVPLFETLLLPSGKPSALPYVCYANVLVWRCLLDIGVLYDRIRDLDRSDEAKALANQVKAAVLQHFIVEGPFGEMFARAIDLEGNYELADDPEGSLQLLTYYGFCEPNDPVYRNTVEWINSEHNPDCSGHICASSAEEQGGRPVSILKLANDLLTGRKDDVLQYLKSAPLDDGIACELADASTGKAISGMAYASYAGRLAFALRTALGASRPDAAVKVRKRRASETLYEPPPEPSQDSKKARL